jgi:hypothetical protein
MESQFTGVPAPYIEGIWNQLEPLLEKPLKRMEIEARIKPEHVKAHLLARQWQCWVAASEPDKIESCLITYIDVYPSGLKELVVFLVGGGNMTGWAKPAGEMLLNFAKEQSCSYIRGMGREGWIRAFGRVFPDHEIKRELTFTIEV